MRRGLDKLGIIRRFIVTSRDSHKRIENAATLRRQSDCEAFVVENIRFKAPCSLVDLTHVNRIVSTSVLAAALLVTGCTSDNAALEGELGLLNVEVESLQEQVASLSKSETDTEASTSTTTTQVSTSTTTTSPDPLSLPPFPPELTEFTHGGDTWVVVLAASETYNDPALITAKLVAEKAGYTTAQTDCDFGVAELLELPSDRHYLTVSVYLQSEEGAISAREAFAARGVGGMEGVVQTFCLD